MTSFSREDLLSFLDYLADKGLAKRSTVVSRKAAVNTLLSILDASEAANLQDMDVDDLLSRFGNLRKHEFKPASLQVYKSRLNSVISEFQKWKSSPSTFKPDSQTRERSSRTNGDVKPVPAPAGQTSSTLTGPTNQAAFDERVEEITFPIPIRRGVIVRVTGIPSDLTPDEATKIGNVILALSGSQEGDP